MAEQKREPRQMEMRSEMERPKQWMPPTLLPDPEPEAGWKFRWIRMSMLNSYDAVNISSKIREGWEPVKAADQPKLRFLNNPNGRFPDGIEIGGLLLCKTPAEFVEQRDAYFQNQAEQQMMSVENSFMRDNDPRMRKFNDQRTQVTIGRSV
jgi:hypothetical protein